MSTGATTVGGRLRPLVYGRDGDRVRATWRVLLAWPLLWVVAGGVLAGNLVPVLAPVLPGGTLGVGLAMSALHAGFAVAVLAPWARFLDRRPLSDYGFAATPAWALDAVAGFVALVGGFVAWFALGAALGETTLSLSAGAPDRSLAVVAAVLLVALLLHAAVQQLVFFRVGLGAAVEGLSARGLATPWAAAGALPVAAALFVGMHDLPTGMRALDLAVVGVVFGLLYLQSGDLALGTGMHFGALYAGNVLFAPAATAADRASVVAVEGTLPGLLGTLGGYGFPKVVLGYLLLLGWLRYRAGEVSLRAPLAGEPIGE